MLTLWFSSGLYRYSGTRRPLLQAAQPYQPEVGGNACEVPLVHTDVGISVSSVPLCLNVFCLGQSWFVLKHRDTEITEELGTADNVAGRNES